MNKSPLLTHDPALVQRVVEGAELHITASQRLGMRLLGQVAAVSGSPFHSGRLDLLNARACNNWAREASGAWERVPSAVAPIGVEDFKEALQALIPRLQALHDRAAASLLAVADEQPSYVVRDGRICRLAAGRIEPLCNFTASIVGEVLIDDGASERGELTIDGVLDTSQSLGLARVPLAQFARMEWVLVQWGTRARIAAGAGVKDQLREAIQWLSPEVPRTRIFGHAGWRRLADGWQWLHAGGAIGPNAPHAPQAPQTPDEVMQVLLAGNLQHLRLPPPPTGRDLRTAIAASLAALEVAPDHVSVPLLASVFRAPLAEVLPVDVSVYLVGQSGTGKSELSALAQAHFGAGFTRLTLPAQWLSTGNALERLAFEAKDCLLVIDDFAPKGSPLEVTKLHAGADRIFRGAGNRGGRSRMAADGTLRPDYPPRGLLLSSGEDVPAGHSLAARLFVVEVAPGAVRLHRLSAAQRTAREGQYAAAMAGYLAWLAPQLDALRVSLPARVAALRSDIQVGRLHQRTPDAVASLLIGWDLWLRFAVEAGALEQSIASTLLRRACGALRAVGRAQMQHTAPQAPAQRFVDLLSAALASQRAHLIALDGSRPETPERWGWRPAQQAVWDGAGGCMVDQRTWIIAPGSKHIGWVVSCEDVYLQPDSAYAAVQHLAAEKRESLPVGEKTLWKRLHDAGMLASEDSAEGKHLIRRKIGGHRQYVLHVHARFLDAFSQGESGGSGARPASTREGEAASTPDPRPVSTGTPLAEGHGSGA